MSLPHIKNSKAGNNRETPLFKNLFEVYFSIPDALAAATGADDVNTLSEQITNISGLDNLTATPGTVQQSYMGAKRTYIGTMVEDTSHTLSIGLNLNMRNQTDNYIFKLFRNWNNLSYNMNTGERALPADYTADFLRVVMYNQAGDIYRDITYHKVMLTKVSGVDELNYDSGTEIFNLELEFKSDWADDIDA